MGNYRNRRRTEVNLKHRLNLFQWSSMVNMEIGVPLIEAQWFQDLCDEIGLPMQQVLQMFVLYLLSHRGDTKQILLDLLYHWDNPDNTAMFQLQADIEREQAQWLR